MLPTVCGVWSSSIELTVKIGNRSKLLKLHLTKFSGDIIKFRTFWGSYESTIY